MFYSIRTWWSRRKVWKILDKKKRRPFPSLYIKLLNFYFNYEAITIHPTYRQEWLAHTVLFTTSQCPLTSQHLGGILMPKDHYIRETGPRMEAECNLKCEALGRQLLAPRPVVSVTQAVIRCYLVFISVVLIRQRGPGRWKSRGRGSTTGQE